MTNTKLIALLFALMVFFSVNSIGLMFRGATFFGVWSLFAGAGAAYFFMRGILEYRRPAQSLDGQANSHLEKR